jgi:ATP-dependent helicase Lhr and Lhr-like helicase
MSRFSRAVMAELPPRFRDWFDGKGWTPRAHQLALLDKHEARRSALLIAPTGAGKTLAGFLPTLIELMDKPKRNDVRPTGIHTLYISPLKALAVDIERNLERPIAEMRLPIRVETRTGDTPASKRDRQRRQPPDILLTTPEQVALMVTSADAESYFDGLERVIFDELHALTPTKRGDLLALGFARLRRLSPKLVATGLSATVKSPEELQAWLVEQGVGSPSPRERGKGWGEGLGGLARHHPAPLLEPLPAGGERENRPNLADLVLAEPSIAAPPVIRMLETERRLPWSGHTTSHAVGEIYETLKRHRMTLVFTNTRMQAEFLFQLLWSVNDDGLRIALHHGSLDVSQRRKVEAAMQEARLDAIVCTSTLDLGIDWGDVDLVVCVGAPKGASRLLQRIGRANHRLDEPSKALLVPSNRFEVLECKAAIDAAYAGEQDAEVSRAGAIDVLAQHVLGLACAGPFHADEAYAEVASAAPYAWLDRETFDDVLAFVATGGYALRSYDRFAKIRQDKDGRWRAANPRVVQQYRMNVGTIIAGTTLKVRFGKARGSAFVGGRTIGEIEEYFAETMTPGDTFVFAGEVLKFEGIHEDSVLVSRAAATADPKVPSYAGSKFPLSTHLAARVRDMLADPATWPGLPEQVSDWLGVQKRKSRLPKRGELLVETFEHRGRHHLVAYPFEGRLAHQTLGMLLTRRLERARLRPQGFVANDYAISVWGLGDIQARIAREPAFLGALFDQDMLGDDLEEWLAESALMKRTFRYCAVIAGLVERKLPGAAEKRGRQITMSTDLVYDVLRLHEPNHILLRAARADAATGLLDIRRLGAMLARIKGCIAHEPLERASPLSVPVLLEIGRETVYGEAADALLEEAAEELIAEAMQE